MKWTTLCYLILLSGCMVGPKYGKPEIAMPSAFVENKEDAPCTDEELCNWWKQFGDPLLDSLIEEAAQKNFDLRIAIEQIIEARAQYRIQGSYLWPEFDLNAVATRSRYSQNIFTTASTATSFASGKESSVSRGSMFGPPVQNFFQVGFDAIWELDFWGKFRRGKQAAFDQWEASELNAQNVLITIISEVARDYVSIRSLQLQIEWTKNKILADKRELDLAKVLFEAGLDNQIQVDAFIATLESDQATLPILESSLKTTLYALAVLLGRQPENLADAFDEIRAIPSGLGKVPAGLPADLLRRRPDVKQAERQLAAATEQIGVAVAGLFPHITLTGNGYGFESNHLKNWFTHPSSYWTIGPNINWDIIDFGKTRGQIAVANAVQKQALLNYEQIVITSLQDVEGALVSYFEEQKRNLHLNDQADANRNSFRLTEDQFRAGLTDELAVLDTIKTLIDTEITLTQSNQALVSDLIALYKALGGNWTCSSTP
jgi:outer membrane protein, multidrug efflux system